LSPDTAPEHLESLAVSHISCLRLPWREANLTHRVLLLVP